MNTTSLKLKLLYGFGFASRGIKDGLFQLFLFFYFSQVLGLDANLAGVSSLIALLFDAVSDPLVGLISDKWQSKKWGRRHPFMFASAIPLGFFTWVLFSPPADLSQTALFWWLTGFAILVRLALTLFVVPHISLGAELTTDYKERTAVTAYRVLFAAFVAPLVMIVGYSFYFVPTETVSNGLLNETAYGQFAGLCGILMTSCILICAWTTKRVIPHLPQPSAFQSQLTSTQLLSSLKIAFSMPSFRSLVIYSMFVFIGLGVAVIFTPYFGTYYFGFTALEMGALPIGSAIGAFIALFIAPTLGDKLDKKWGTLISAGFAGILFTLPFNLRLLGIFPKNNSDYLLITYVGILVLGYAALYTSASIAPSMMADVVDEFELKSGNRQEGLFFSTLSFAHKTTTGFGMLFAGMLLSAIHFPKQADVGDIPAEVIHNLGYIGGPVLLIFYIIALFFLLSYPLTKERYLAIRAQLDARHRDL